LCTREGLILRRICGYMTVIALLGVVLTMTAGSGSAAVISAAGNVKLLLIDQNSTAYDWAKVARHYSAVNLNDWNNGWIRQIRSANPHAAVFVYKDLTSTREDDCGANPGGGSPCIVHGVICPRGTNDAKYYAGGLGFCNAWRTDPSWFLTKSGVRTTSSTRPFQLATEAGFPTQFMMNYGNAGYQNAWLSAVKADVRTNGWSGVLADNAISTATEYGSNGQPASRAYRTDAGAQAAMRSMLRVVGPGLTRAGFSIIPNLGYDNLYPRLWAAWLPYVTGFMDEWSYFWPGNGSEGSSVGSWGPWMEPEVQACARQGKECFFHYGDHSQALSSAQASFALASYLLYADGNSYIEYAGDGPRDPQTRLGAALGPATESANGVYRRQFAYGVVTVNSARGVGTISHVSASPGRSVAPSKRPSGSPSAPTVNSRTSRPQTRAGTAAKPAPPGGQRTTAAPATLTRSPDSAGHAIGEGSDAARGQSVAVGVGSAATGTTMAVVLAASVLVAGFAARRKLARLRARGDRDTSRRVVGAHKRTSR
jgi:hypothetical protein